jgi:hypothetical protein
MEWTSRNQFVSGPARNLVRINVEANDPTHSTRWLVGVLVPRYDGHL